LASVEGEMALAANSSHADPHFGQLVNQFGYSKPHFEQFLVKYRVVFIPRAFLSFPIYEIKLYEIKFPNKFCLNIKK
jgi:hypothetical protein